MNKLIKRIEYKKFKWDFSELNKQFELFKYCQLISKVKNFQKVIKKRQSKNTEAKKL